MLLQADEIIRASLGGHKIRRHQIQRLLRLAQHFFQMADEQFLVFGLGQAFVWVINDEAGRRPFQRQLPLNKLLHKRHIGDGLHVFTRRGRARHDGSVLRPRGLLLRIDGLYHLA